MLYELGIGFVNIGMVGTWIQPERFMLEGWFPVLQFERMVGSLIDVP